MQHTLAISNSEEEYACLLMDFMNQSPEFIFRAVTFTSVTNYLEYAKQKGIDILLFDHEWTEDELQQSTAKASYCLTENPKEKTYLNRPCIFMYQSAIKIMSDILEQYDKEGNILSINTASDTLIYGISQAMESDQQTLFSLGLASELQKKGKTLYLNLQPFISTELFESQEQYLLTDAIYLMKQEGTGKAAKLKSMIGHTDAVDYLVGVEHYSDLADVNAEDVNELISTIRELGIYDAIVIVLSLQCRSFTAWIDVCDVIYELENHSVSYQRLQKQLIRQLSLEEGEKALHKIQLIDCSNLPLDIAYSFNAIRTSKWAYAAAEYCK